MIGQYVIAATAFSSFGMPRPCTLLALREAAHALTD